MPEPVQSGAPIKANLTYLMDAGNWRSSMGVESRCRQKTAAPFPAEPVMPQPMRLAVVFGRFARLLRDRRPRYRRFCFIAD